jgi:hypothetical protein
MQGVAGALLVWFVLVGLRGRVPPQARVAARDAPGCSPVPTPTASDEEAGPVMRASASSGLLSSIGLRKGSAERWAHP